MEFRGIIPPLVTPLVDRDRLDVDGLMRLIQHVVDGGVDGLFILGSTGEAPSLSYRLRRELVTRVCDLIDERIPVLVGITDTAFVESVALARHAAESGASGVVLTTPYYFPAGQTELTGYVRNLVPELPLPIMLYNMPALTKVWFEPETLKRLSDLDSIVGFKDSSGDLEYFQRILELKKTERPDWSVLIGPEHYLVESVRMGGDGGVSGGGNVLPDLFVQAFKAAAAGNQEEIAKCQQRIEALQQIYTIGKYASRFIKATKCCLSLLKICDDFMAEPFHSFREPERKRVCEILSTLVDSVEFSSAR